MPRHPRWGRSIDEYFFRNPASAFRPGEPTTEDCAPFLRTLSLLQYPKKLRAIADTNSLSNIINALRDSRYTIDSDPRTNPLFSYEYGFLAFRCIVLLMQAGILARTNNFSAFERRAGHLSDPHAVSVVLSGFTSELMYEALKKPRPRDWLLGTSTPQADSRVLLGTVGGFTDTDVDILLWELWDDRKSFLSIITQAPELIPGWGLPLMLIAEHLVWAMEAASDIDVQEDWDLLQVLCFRYALVAPSHELDLIAVTSFRAELHGTPMDSEDNNNEIHEESLADDDDAQTLLVSYLERATSSTLKRLPDGLAVQLVAYLRNYMIFDIVECMPSLVETLCARIWEFIDSVPDKQPSHNVHMLMYAWRTFDLLKRLFAVYIGAPSEIVSLLVKPLARQDFINLCGRVVMLPLSMGSDIARIADENPKSFDGVIDPDRPYSTPYLWHHIALRVVGFATSYCRCDPSSSGAISLHFEEWMKLSRCFEAGFPQHHSSAESLSKFKQTAWAALEVLGSSFGFVDRKILIRMVCFNPRCPGASAETNSQFVCGRCLDAIYCSRWCRSVHWTAVAGNSHSKNCLGASAEDAQ